MGEVKRGSGVGKRLSMGLCALEEIKGSVMLARQRKATEILGIGVRHKSATL